MQRAQTDPHISIYLEPSRGDFGTADLVVHNLAPQKEFRITLGLMYGFGIDQSTDPITVGMTYWGSVGKPVHECFVLDFQDLGSSTVDRSNYRIANSLHWIAEMMSADRVSYSPGPTRGFPYSAQQMTQALNRIADQLSERTSEPRPSLGRRLLSRLHNRT